MKVWELVKKLEKCDPGFEVKIMAEETAIEDLDEPLVEVKSDSKVVLL